MKLSVAAGMGDTLLASDAYGADTFMCQLDALSYAKVDGVMVRKRSISTKPDVVMPARGVIRIQGQEYLVGTDVDDYWKGSPIRTNYVIQGTDGLANLSSIAQALANTAPSTAYASLVFSRYLPDEADSSKYPPQYQLFLAGSESVPTDSLLQLNGVWYLIKSSYHSTSGLRIGMANEIKGTVFETVSVSGRTYDPLTDTYSGAPAIIKIMRVKWQEHFNYLTKGQINYERGDEQLFILKTQMSPAPADTLTLSDGSWKIMDVQDEGLIWSCHVRRV